jgi:hypothetical protein
MLKYHGQDSEIRQAFDRVRHNIPVHKPKPWSKKKKDVKPRDEAPHHCLGITRWYGRP